MPTQASDQEDFGSCGRRPLTASLNQRLDHRIGLGRARRIERDEDRVRVRVAHEPGTRRVRVPDQRVAA